MDDTFQIYNLLSEYKDSDIVLSLEQERELIIEYVYVTNKLEGNILTYAQTKSIIEDGVISGDNIKTRDLLEQKGTYKALIRMLEAVNKKEELSTSLIKELNWLSIGSVFLDDYYMGYKEAGQKMGEYKVKNNRIHIIQDGKDFFVEPLSNPNSVNTNMDMLIRQIALSEKTITEKAAFLAQEIWLHQPFIDGNKRTARLLINFITMKEGFPLFTYSDRGHLFNDMLVTQYTLGKKGLIQEYIEICLRDRINKLLQIQNNKQSKLRGFRFIL